MLLGSWSAAQRTSGIATTSSICNHHIPCLLHNRNAFDSGAAQRCSSKSRRTCSKTVASATIISSPDPVFGQDIGRPVIPQMPPVADRIAVLLLNLGGPDSLEDVQPFLFNLFADPDIIRLPPGLQFLQNTIATVISSLRAPKSTEGYKAIGGGSPLRRITEEQAAALQSALQRKGQDAAVFVGMRYWSPFTEDAMELIKQDKDISCLVILPLYPQFSISTSGSSLRLLEKIIKEDPDLRTLPHVCIPSWYNRPGYVTAIADLTQQELEKFGRDEDVEIFFSAHGVPKSYIEEGDPYKEEMEQCVGLIMAELRRRGIQNHHTLAYQSRVGPVEWLQPYTDDAIRYLGSAGKKAMLAVPISFVSEHIETLEEIDMEYRELAEASGIERWGRVPALNTNPTFIDDLADAVLQALPSAGSMIGRNPDDSLVPWGDVEALLEIYDKERRVLPPPILMWQWGWTTSAETWNGRMAMLAVVVILLMEIVTGQGVLSAWLQL